VTAASSRDAAHRLVPLQAGTFIVTVHADLCGHEFHRIDNRSPDQVARLLARRSTETPQFVQTSSALAGYATPMPRSDS
jgi:cobyrinic acid a,c-diamide synthase